MAPHPRNVFNLTDTISPIPTPPVVKRSLSDGILDKVVYPGFGFLWSLFIGLWSLLETFWSSLLQPLLKLLWAVALLALICLVCFSLIAGIFLLSIKATKWVIRYWPGRSGASKQEENVEGEVVFDTEVVQQQDVDLESEGSEGSMHPGVLTPDTDTTTIDGSTLNDDDDGSDDGDKNSEVDCSLETQKDDSRANSGAAEEDKAFRQEYTANASLQPDDNQDYGHLSDSINSLFVDTGCHDQSPPGSSCSHSQNREQVMMQQATARFRRSYLDDHISRADAINEMYDSVGEIMNGIPLDEYDRRANVLDELDRFVKDVMNEVPSVETW